MIRWLFLPVLFALASGAEEKTFQSRVAPILNQYCYGCHGNGKHKGDLTLDPYTNTTSVLSDRRTWDKVLQKIEAREMPPEEKPQPSEKERTLLSRWIKDTVLKCDGANPDPGRVTIHRLNRAEYNNTIRDLLGINFHPADDFPADDSGYGFDNVGDALSMPPVLVEKYLNAAATILEVALPLKRPGRPATTRYPVDALEVGYNAKRMGNGWVTLNSIEEDDVALHLTLPVKGRYILRIHAYGRQETNLPVRLSFKLDDRILRTVEVETNSAAPRLYEETVNIPPGKHRLSAAVLRIKDGLSPKDAAIWKKGPNQKGVVMVEYVELESPDPADAAAQSTAYRRIFARRPAAGRESGLAREVIGDFAKRAYRRPIRAAEMDRFMTLIERFWRDQRSGSNEVAQTGQAAAGSGMSQENFEAGIRLAVQAMLVSPYFLFRGELQPDPNNPAAIHRIDEYALASRLSYFLWSSMPDDELFRQAERGTLRKNLESQVRRMLRDPKSNSLVENFAGQWLQIRNLDFVSPDPELFPEFDDELRSSMRKETELFFEAILREDRSVLDFLTADFTFVDARLAQHYGMTNLNERLIKGSAASSDSPGFQRVSLAGTERRGILTQAGILTLTSNPTRTSPVKRGKWVLENILNAPPPPPPPEVPELSESKEKVLSGTLRQRMEEHRANPTCASCHARMDPIGFGLENFNAIGAWRIKDGSMPVDPAGKLVSGESFRGAKDLSKIMSGQKKEEFLRCLAEKTLTYALGRGMEYYDHCAVEQIAGGLKSGRYRFSSLILAVVKSAPFQMRRGESRPASLARRD